MEKLQKVEKVEKWKTIKVPEEVWRAIKIEAAKRGHNLYTELAEKYEV